MMATIGTSMQAQLSDEILDRDQALRTYMLRRRERLAKLNAEEQQS